MHEINGGLDFSLKTTLASVGQYLMFVFGWVHRGSTVFFSLTLTISELRTLFFVSSHYVYKVDCFLMVIHLIGKEAYTRALQKIGLTTARCRANIWQYNSFKRPVTSAERSKAVVPMLIHCVLLSPLCVCVHERARACVCVLRGMFGSWFVVHYLMSF